MQGALRRSIVVPGLLFTALLAIAPRPVHAAFNFEPADASAHFVGQYTSLALDAQGNPFISYYDETDGNLRVARKSSGIWILETADPSPTVEGLFTSIALDGSGQPRVSYYRDTGGDLMYAWKSGGTWFHEPVDAGTDDVGLDTSLELDALGNPRISYYDLTNGNLRFAWKSGGTWTTEDADDSGNDVGSYSSLALDAQGNPHISYYDATAGDLLYASKSGGVWTVETVDGGPCPTCFSAAGSGPDVGRYSSLVLDAHGEPHISYYDADSGNLKYARKFGTTWLVETVDDSDDDVGYDSAIALDAYGRPRITYQDGTIEDLMYARRDGAGWVVDDADISFNSTGWYTSIALDATGSPRVSHQDATTSNLIYGWAPADVTGVPPTVAARERASLSIRPNPSNADVRIECAPEFAARRLEVVDLGGRLVKRWELDGGTSARWDGRGADGRAVDPGVYFVRAEDATGHSTEPRRIVRLR